MALFSLETYGQSDPHLQQEWLLTNGLGGYAFSTVLGCNTRRYHGLLCAATLPPVGRILALSRIGEIVSFDGDDSQLFEFSVNQFREGFHPHGWHYLRKFELEDAAHWEYEIEGVRIVKEVQMLWRQNVVGVRYTIDPPRKRQVKLALLPFFGLRDFHGLRHSQDTTFNVTSAQQKVEVTVDSHSCYVVADSGTFEPHSDWWYGHYYAIDNDRGMDDCEDLYTPGRFVLETTGHASITLWASMDGAGPFDWETELGNRRQAMTAAHTAPIDVHPKDRPMLASARESGVIKGLVRAANDFIVERKMPSGQDGSTVIAGYPWFADWGRDTMISLPGLFLVTGRFEQAKQVLGVFAQYVSDGMIPNRFDDYTNEPHYNTVDASLWFIHAAFEYLRYSNDRKTFGGILLPACRQIIAGYRKGTRYHIRMDEADGLISQGDEHTQLTWMDAKTNDVAFTPRQGKAVEINALWYHAIKLMGDEPLAARVADSFRKAFWISPFRGLADVVDGSPTPDGYPRRDTSLRPNQIFAVSLPNSPLMPDQQRAVVEVVRRELLTAMGLKSLAKGDSRFCGRYAGDQFKRDACYHNGTVWAWLIGGFLSAYLRVNNHSVESVDHARGWLQPLLDQMHTNCIGQIAEIYEGDEPHRMVGCPAQAWSVAEALRLAVDLGL
ncbi:MAG TPA: amylo-alpha-1,6-glucosidase [Tepidisphaeraceae bacterium]|nr:amylo-alpha-1,6-glucosidase [Tepidisphaeraceae bacterium]